MLRYVIALAMMCPLGCVLAQPVDPGLHPRPAAGEESHHAPTAEEAALLYPTRRDAAFAAFRTGYEAGRKGDFERSIDLFLEALKREPSLSKALFNLGVECSAADSPRRLDDARQFYEEYRQRPGADPKLVGAELARIDAVSKLDIKRRAFLKDFQPLVDEKNVDLAMVKLGSLAKQYPTQWESEALLAEYLARAGRFQESIDSLHSAARRAPIELQSKLNAAADLARVEVDFATRVNNADQARQEARYEAAAKMYSDAWHIKQSRADLIMNAATAQLMADNVDGAVMNLDRARTAADPEISAKAIKMLKALVDIYPDAAALGSGNSGAPPPAEKTTAQSIADLIGPLKTPEMVLALQAPPPLFEEKSDVLVPPQDVKVYGTGTIPEFKSTDSIFEIYQRNVREAESRQQAALADSAPPAVVAADVQPNVAEPPRVQQSMPAPPAVRTNSGPLQQVSIMTVPQGASVQLDESGEDGPTQQCTSPCEFPLPVGTRHTLRITLEGYRPFLKIIESVPRGGQTLPVTLVEATGCLMLPASDGIVRVDGVRRRTPSQVCVREGMHEITLELNGQTTTQQAKVENEKYTSVTLGQDK